MVAGMWMVDVVDNEPEKLTKNSGSLVPIVCAEVVCTCGRARWWRLYVINTSPCLVYMRRTVQ